MSGGSSTDDVRLESSDRGPFRFVLVEPRSPGNVGASARALKNLGFSRLVLVRPACDPRGPEARRLAVDAADLLERARICDDLDTALRGASAVIGTTRRTGKYRQPHYRIDRICGEIAPHMAAGEVAFVFGREDRGLSDAELDSCTHLVHVPTSNEYPSLNLAQTVLLAAYELTRAGRQEPSDEPVEPPADHIEREALYGHLEEALLAIGFLRPETTETMMRRFRRMLGRTGLTTDEVRMLRGVARQILWCAGKAGLADPPADTGRGT